MGALKLEIYEDRLQPYSSWSTLAPARTLLRGNGDTIVDAQDRNGGFGGEPKGFDLGLASEIRLRRMEEKQDQSDAFVNFFRETSIKPELANPVLESKNSSPVKQSDKMFKLFSRPNITTEDMRKFDVVEQYIQDNELDREVIEQTEIQVKYAGYIEKEKNNADKLNRLEYVKIPSDFDYSQIKSMSYEAREKLKEKQPTSIAQASRISGVSPNDISVLLVYMGR